MDEAQTNTMQTIEAMRHRVRTRSIQTIVLEHIKTTKTGLSDIDIIQASFFKDRFVRRYFHFACLELETLPMFA